MHDYRLTGLEQFDRWLVLSRLARRLGLARVADWLLMRAANAVHFAPVDR